MPHCIYNCLLEDERKRFETCRRQQKLNINLESVHFFGLYCIIHLFILLGVVLSRTSQIVYMFFNWGNKIGSVMYRFKVWPSVDEGCLLKLCLM